jgi:hypothetical protein
MLTTPNGKLAVQAAAESVPFDQFERVVIAIRKDHDEAFGASKALRRAIGSGPEIVVIEHDTNGPAETVAVMIERAGVSGPILIKDADSFFPQTPIPQGSFVTLCDLRKCLEVSSVGAKSFATLNENGLISQIVEKSVSSNFICVGLFAFSSADFYMTCLNKIRKTPTKGEIFVSNVVYEAISSGEPFHPHLVEDFVDVGTLRDWQAFAAKQKLYIVDIDGVIFHNQSEFFPPYWGDAPTPIQPNVDCLKSFQENGAQLVFVTSRPEKYRAATEKALADLGLVMHALVMGASHAPRVLINDFAPSNPYPSAQAINIVRNSADLPKMIS